MEQMVRVTSVEPLDGFRVKLTFSDAGIKVVDLGPFLHGPLFEPLRRDPLKFREVRVNAEFGCIEWPNGADLCTDMLYRGLRPSRLPKTAG